MFTGIVEEVSLVESVDRRGFTVSAFKVMADLNVSDSIAVNGTCLTVTSRKNKSFSVDVVPETIQRTNLNNLKVGGSVNLERALRADGRFGGHMVQGHIDGTASIKSITSDGDAWIVVFDTPSTIMRYIVEKGFVAVDGISLTVVDCESGSFSVTVIPYTREHTTFATRKVEDVVNIEVDILAKYVELATRGSRTVVDSGEEL